MAARAGAWLLVAATALAFVGGTMAPPSLRDTIQQAGQDLLGRLRSATGTTALPGAGTAASGPTAPSPTAVPAAAAAPAAAASSPEAVANAVAAPASAPASAPSQALLLPSQPAAGARYALQVGQFADREPADRLSAGLRGQGEQSSVILSVDPRGTAWAVVTLGVFSSAEQALSQRTYLGNKLGLPQPLAPIVLPTPTPTPTQAAPAAPPAGAASGPATGPA